MPDAGSNDRLNDHGAHVDRVEPAFDDGDLALRLHTFDHES